MIEPPNFKNPVIPKSWPTKLANSVEWTIRLCLPSFVFFFYQISVSNRCCPQWSRGFLWFFTSSSRFQVGFWFKFDNNGFLWYLDDNWKLKSHRNNLLVFTHGLQFSFQNTQKIDIVPILYFPSFVLYKCDHILSPSISLFLQQKPVIGLVILYL